MSPIRNFSGRSSRGFPRRQHLLWFFGDDKSHDALMTLPVEGFNGTLRILLPPSSNNNVIRCLGLGQGRCCRRGKKGAGEMGPMETPSLTFGTKIFRARTHKIFDRHLPWKSFGVNRKFSFHFGSFSLVFFLLLLLLLFFFLHLYFCVDFRSASAKGCGCLGSSQELCGASSSLP